MDILYYFKVALSDPTDEIIKNARESDYYCEKCEKDVGSNSKHCNLCGRCVENFDHHCKWVNNCIGKVNYRTFMKLIFWNNSYLTLICIIFLFKYIYFNPI
jgi:palmitoyltransferase